MKDAASPPRSYRMSARADAVEATVKAILDVAVQLFTDSAYEDVSLEDIAAEASVTKRTILRRFGSKEGLFQAAMQRAAQMMMRQRGTAPVGDIDGAVASVLDHYDRWGLNRLRLLSQEERIPVVRENVEGGRRYHYSWVERTFAPLLEGRSGVERRRTIAALITLTDVYTWKLLRQDLRLSRSETHRLLVDLIMRLEEGE